MKFVTQNLTFPPESYNGEHLSKLNPLAKQTLDYLSHCLNEKLGSVWQWHCSHMVSGTLQSVNTGSLVGTKSTYNFDSWALNKNLTFPFLNFEHVDCRSVAASNTSVKMDNHIKLTYMLPAMPLTYAQQMNNLLYAVNCVILQSLRMKFSETYLSGTAAFNGLIIGQQNTQYGAVVSPDQQKSFPALTIDYHVLTAINSDVDSSYSLIGGIDGQTYLTGSYDSDAPEFLINEWKVDSNE